MSETIARLREAEQVWWDHPHDDPDDPIKSHKLIALVVEVVDGVALVGTICRGLQLAEVDADTDLHRVHHEPGTELAYARYHARGIVRAATFELNTRKRANKHRTDLLVRTIAALAEAAQ